MQKIMKVISREYEPPIIWPVCPESDCRPRVTDDSVKMKGNIWWEYANKESNILVIAGISFWMDENDGNVLGQRKLTC